MFRSRSIALRVAAIMVALAMLLIAAHTHTNGPAGRCDICQVAHVVAHQATAPASVDPPALHRRMAPGGSPFSYETLFRHSVFTRGPPSFSV